MRLRLVATRSEVAAERQRRYLMAWPLSRQAEAIQDALAGRPARLTAMDQDFLRIKAELPYPASASAGEEGAGQ